MTEMKEITFDSPATAAVARDLAILQLAGMDRDELIFSVDDLEAIMDIARGKFKIKGPLQGDRTNEEENRKEKGKEDSKEDS